MLECILGGLHIAVDVESEPEKARAKLAKSKVDALIVDCDLKGTADFLSQLQRQPIQNSVPLVIVSGGNGHNLERKEAAFVFRKPISVEQAVHTLSAARNRIVDERLHYHREVLDVPLWLAGTSKKRTAAHLLNVSQRGARLRARQPLPLNAAVGVNFALPGSKRSLKLQAQVVWSDQGGNAGVRFVDVGPQAKRNLQLWVERQYFTH